MYDTTSALANIDKNSWQILTLLLVTAAFAFIYFFKAIKSGFLAGQHGEMIIANMPLPAAISVGIMLASGLFGGAIALALRKAIADAINPN